MTSVCGEVKSSPPRLIMGDIPFNTKFKATTVMTLEAKDGSDVKTGSGIHFTRLKASLTSASFIWPFEVMCYDNNYVVGVILGKQYDNLPYVIYYASHT